MLTEHARLGVRRRQGEGIVQTTVPVTANIQPQIDRLADASQQTPAIAGDI